MTKFVSVVIPVYNEEDAIKEVVLSVKEVLINSKCNFEILVVDDGSTDKTAEILDSLNVRIIRHTKCRGSGAARKTGILNAKGEIIVMLDGDGSYEPRDIPKMLKEIDGNDQVIGKRKRERGTLPFLRVPMKWCIRKLAEYLTGEKIPDLNSGIRAFRKEIMKKYIWVIPNGFSCVSTMTLSFLCNGHSIKWVDAEYYSRIGKSKFHPIRDTLNYIKTVIRIIMYFRPLRIFLPMGSLLFILGVGRGIYNRFFTVEHTLQEADIILIVFAFLVVVLGLLADLIVSQTNAILNIKK